MFVATLEEYNLKWDRAERGGKAKKRAFATGVGRVLGLVSKDIPSCIVICIVISFYVSRARSQRANTALPRARGLLRLIL